MGSVHLSHNRYPLKRVFVSNIDSQKVFVLYIYLSMIEVCGVFGKHTEGSSSSLSSSSIFFQKENLETTERRCSSPFNISEDLGSIPKQTDNFWFWWIINISMYVWMRMRVCLYIIFVVILSTLQWGWLERYELLLQLAIRARRIEFVWVVTCVVGSSSFAVWILLRF